MINPNYRSDLQFMAWRCNWETRRALLSIALQAVGLLFLCVGMTLLVIHEL